MYELLLYSLYKIVYGMLRQTPFDVKNLKKGFQKPQRHFKRIEKIFRRPTNDGEHVLGICGLST